MHVYKYIWSVTIICMHKYALITAIMQYLCMYLLHPHLGSPKPRILCHCYESQLPSVSSWGRNDRRILRYFAPLSMTGCFRLSWCRYVWKFWVYEESYPSKHDQNKSSMHRVSEPELNIKVRLQFFQESWGLWYNLSNYIASDCIGKCRYIRYEIRDARYGG